MKMKIKEINRENITCLYLIKKDELKWGCVILFMGA
jgi:hypothetical protein